MKTVTNNLVDKTKEKPKPKIDRELQRDNYGLMASFLPLIGVLLWLGLVMINALVIDQSKLTWETTIKRNETQISQTYHDTLITHGELVTKTNDLSGVIDKDIQPEEVFILVDKLFPTDRDFTVTGFGREDDGSFNVTVSAATYIKFTKIARRFNTYDKVKNVQIKNVNLDSSNLIIGSINFFFTSPELNSATKSTTNTTTN